MIVIRSVPTSSLSEKQLHQLSLTMRNCEWPCLSRNKCNFRRSMPREAFSLGSLPFLEGSSMAHTGRAIVNDVNVPHEKGTWGCIGQRSE